MDQPRRVDEHGDPRQNFAGEGVDLPRQPPEQQNTGGLFGRYFALCGDQPAQFDDQPRPRRFVLERIDELLQFVHRNLRRLGSRFRRRGRGVCGGR